MKMKIRRIYAAITTVCLAATCISTYKAYEAYQTDSNADLLLSENSIALSQGEYISDCVRKESSCTIYVGAKGSIKLLGGDIITAGADGNIKIDGQVECSSGGKTYCLPIECKELYSSVIK